MTAPPAGWAAHDFWHDLHLEVAAHREALAVAALFLLMLVIGRALLDTLGNLLSGIAMQLEAPFSIGDWIRVDDKAIGRVLEIRWRSTLIQTKNDDLVVIPNAILTKGVVTVFGKDGLENR